MFAGPLAPPTRPLRVAFFGLPLAAWLLARDGHAIVSAALIWKGAIGTRRLTRALGADRISVKPRLDARLIDKVRALEPDLVVSWFWTNKLPMKLIEVAPLGGVGVHPSLLPRHRGPDPTAHAILAGDAATGVTAHRIAAEYDTGAILGQRSLAIDPSWNAWQLAKALDRPSLALLRDIVAAFARGEPPAELAQDEAQATAAPLPSDDDLEISFRWSTDRVLRHIRAYAPSPGAFTEIAGRTYTVLAARACPCPNVLEEPGEGLFTATRAVVRTADGAIELLALELDGERVPPSSLATNVPSLA